jgi:ketosteroid isomerase-like protein
MLASEDAMDSTHSEIAEFLENQAEAMRAKDLDLLMTFYSPDIVYFDVVPPLRFVGAEALRGRFGRWFAGFRGPIDLSIRDLTIAVSGDLALAHWFSRARGTLLNGREAGTWVRASNCSRRSPGGWLVTHEHVSVPADLASGRAAVDLTP